MFKSAVNLGQLIGFAVSMVMAILGMGAYLGAINERVQTLQIRQAKIELILEKQVQLSLRQSESQKFMLEMIRELKNQKNGNN